MKVTCALGHRVEAGRAYAYSGPDGRRRFACVGACARLLVHGPGLRAQNAAAALLEDEREAARQGELGLEARAAR